MDMSNCPGRLRVFLTMGLKIFVQVQTFRRRPFVPSHNFCHPGFYNTWWLFSNELCASGISTRWKLMYTRYTWRLCLSHIEVDLNPQGVLAEDPAQHLLWLLAKQLRLPTAGVQARLTLVNIFFFPCSSLWLSLPLQLFLRLSKQRSLLFRRMLRSVSWELPARSDQRIVLQFFAFLPKHRGEEYKPSFQQHQRQRLRK